MKKQYITPHTEVTEMESSVLLSVSGALEGEATTPALSRDDTWLLE